MVKNALKYFTDMGLKAEDAKVYLACMQKPNGLFVHEIVRQTQVKRSTVDLILDRLRRQGFVSRRKEGARWVYSAEPPERIAFSFEQKLQGFQGILPDLSRIMAEGQAPVVRFFEGPESLEQVFDDILLTCQAQPLKERELLIISSGRDLIRLLPNHEQRFIRKRVKKNIPVRMLAPGNSVTERLYKNDAAHLRQTRLFDEKRYPFRVEMDIYGDKIALLNFNASSAMGVIIQSGPIVSSMRTIFEMIWGFSGLLKKDQ